MCRVGPDVRLQFLVNGISGNVKVNLVEKITLDCNVDLHAGACRPPVSQGGAPSKFCSLLEVVDLGRWAFGRKHELHFSKMSQYHLLLPSRRVGSLGRGGTS
jgi:hypothetical protein